jgi:hypothetical protein
MTLFPDWLIMALPKLQVLCPEVTGLPATFH